MTNPNITTYWQSFLTATNRPATTPYKDCFAFGHTPALNDSLLALVLSGQKTATSSAHPAYLATNEPLPAPGDLSIVLDSNGTPRCVIETTQITILPFRDMTFDLCRLEGEDDNLASWQHNHEIAFRASEAEEGYTFTPDMKVVFEQFVLVYQ